MKKKKKEKQNVGGEIRIIKIKCPLSMAGVRPKKTHAESKKEKEKVGKGEPLHTVAGFPCITTEAQIGPAGKGLGRKTPKKIQTHKARKPS